MTQRAIDQTAGRQPWTEVDPSGAPAPRGLADKIQQRFGFAPKSWQACATADCIRGDDVIVIAGTGSGKSLVYQAILAVSEKAIVLVVSPTLALIRDQAQWVIDQGFRVAELTRENLMVNPALWNQVDSGAFDLVLASPEVLLRDGSHFWLKTIRGRSNQFCTRLKAVAVDESHLVWGWREFRKDYLNIGALRAHFPTIPIIALSATLMPNVLAFVSQSLQLRPGRTRLYRLSIDRPNIMHIVSKLPTKQSIDYSKLDFLLSRQGPIWSIHKAMVFVDNIDEAHKIYLWLAARAKHFWAERADSVIRPYSSNLEAATRDRFMNAFRDGSTRILICTDAAGMGLHVPDVKIIVQWKLRRRLGRAGRDTRIAAISIVFADSQFFLANGPECPEQYQDYIQKVIPGDTVSRNRVRDMISSFYKDKNPSERGKTDTACARLDPGLLFYVNTLGCRCRAALATFGDSAAYESQNRAPGCCDNMLYLLDPDDAQNCVLNGVSASLSFENLARPQLQQFDKQSTLG
ncbi:P-loop containing nucleoside triphosphate hydrolase protein [Sphaerosporella brunnea]|uniref:DNA 3'-5' helicase n=1 Tax=Sphaerosporella brunnea TaxID=1250544 RepID=A0A5J5F7Z1_9PEZI|nr:P-loop containing nucleoside triphosphate hydrolase protein [Sphaerosporella brunnea]